MKTKAFAIHQTSTATFWAMLPEMATKITARWEGMKMEVGWNEGATRKRGFVSPRATQSAQQMKNPFAIKS